jgi:DNA-binding transcriptional LysR family regulator
VDLTVQQLRVIVAVAEAGSFTAAAAGLRVAQSSLSRTVADVERRTGVVLFQRTTRRVVLTPEGQEFARVARRVIESFDAGMNHFAGFLDGTRGIVRVATLPSLAATFLPSIVASFRAEHPDVRVVVEDALLGQVLERVAGGHVDFAVTVASEARTSFDFTPVATDDFLCVFPPSHRFRTSSTLEWRDMEGEPFISFDRTSSVRALVDRAFDSASVVPGPVTEARNIASVGGLVAAGLGISAVPALVLPLLEFAHLGHKPLVNPAVERVIGVVRDLDRPLAPAVRAFLGSIDEARTAGVGLPKGAHWPHERPKQVPR